MKKILSLLVITVFVAFFASGSALATDWHVPGDFATIQEAIDNLNVVDGDKIKVGKGSWAGALVTKAVDIEGKGKAIISSGPLHGSGLVIGFRLLAGSSGASISNLTFEGVDLAIIPGNLNPPYVGPVLSNVSIHHNTFINTVQAVSAWRAIGWEISHNEIIDLRTRNGGGIGILVGDYMGREVKDNVVSHNNIKGVLHVPTTDDGGYSGTGIVLFADFRWNRAGATEISNNRIMHNKIELVSDTPTVVDVVAIELTVAGTFTGGLPIYDNIVTKNEIRGMENQIISTPEELADWNTIDKNRIKKGKHPKKQSKPKE